MAAFQLLHSIMLSQILILLGAAIVALFGALHRYLTYFSHRFEPRDRALATRLHEVALVATTETSYQRAILGFHVSHSLGALFFGPCTAISHWRNRHSCFTRR